MVNMHEIEVEIIMFYESTRWVACSFNHATNQEELHIWRVICNTISNLFIQVENETKQEYFLMYISQFYFDEFRKFLLIYNLGFYQRCLFTYNEWH